MKKVILSFTFVLSLLILSCGAKMEKSEMADTISNEASATTQLAATPNTDLYSDGKTKLIKTADYRFEVINVKKSAEAIEGYVRKFPAYISNSSLKLENPILEQKMTIHVQNEFFHDLLKEIDQQAHFINFRDVKTEDVSKQFVDLESRLKTKREIEARYMEILRKKAGTIEELLEAEKQIGELHEEIEATISRINYLKDEVSYSTLNLEFYQTISQEIAHIEEAPLAPQFGKALAAGWTGIVNVLIVLTYLWPLFVLTGLAVATLRYLKKRKAAAL